MTVRVELMQDCSIHNMECKVAETGSSVSSGS